ncbi:MAG: RNB domain-containing ribonuclease, partial [Xanthomonadaceae bacterium]|nr:RNB domain-containing ribonuclease [Xanthomonadaceae bacterium]
CEMEIDKRGTVVNHKIYESAIRSNARLTYKQVQRILDREEKIGKPIEKGIRSPNCFMPPQKKMEVAMSIIGGKGRLQA